MNLTHPAFPAKAVTPSSPINLGSFCLRIMLMLSLTLCVARASTADDDYINICVMMNQADELSQNGDGNGAHEKYIEAQGALAVFQKINPNWQPEVVTFRLNYLAKKISPPVETPAPKPVSDVVAPPIAPSANHQSDAVEPVRDDAPAKNTADANPPVIAIQKSPVKLLEAGSEPRTSLRFHPNIGDKRTLGMNIKMSMATTVAGQAMPAVKMPVMQMTIQMEVKNVAANGDIAYVLSYEDATVVADTNIPPVMVNAMKSALEGIRGLSGTGKMNDRGLILSMQMKLPANANPQMSQMMDQVKDSFSSSSTPFPDEAVGTGAKWEYNTKIKSQGMTMNQTITSELASLEGTHLTLNNTITQNADHQKIQNASMPGLKMELTKMTGSGGGTSTFDLAGFLPMSATLDESIEMAMDMDTGKQKQNMNMNMTINVTVESK